MRAESGSEAEKAEDKSNKELMGRYGVILGRTPRWQSFSLEFGKDGSMTYAENSDYYLGIECNGPER